MINRDFSAKRASNVLAATTDAQLFQCADGSGDVQVFVPAGTKAFRVRAFGSMTTATTTTFTPNIYFGNATTTVLCTNSTVQINSTSGSWMLEATCYLDVTLGKIAGKRNGWQGTTPTAVTDAVITLVTCTTQADLNGKALAVGCTFSSADAGNIGKLDSFTLEVLELAK